MKILVLNYEFPPLGGGASPVSYEISKGYVKLGYQVDVITMGFSGLPEYESKEGVHIYRVTKMRTQKSVCYPWEQLIYVWFGYKKAVTLLKQKKYDICHTHFVLPTGIIAYMLQKYYNLPYVLTAHGSDIPGYNTLRFTFLHKYTPFLIKKIISACRILISPSKFLADLIVKVDAKFSSKIVIIPNGIEEGKFFPGKKQNYILMVSRLQKGKGIQDFIEAMSQIDMGDWKVKIVGDGPYKKDLQKLVESYKLSSQVDFLGWIDNTAGELKQLYAQASIFCQPSYFENASIVLLEAMQSGCAVLARDIGGNKELLSGDQLFHSGKELNEKLSKYIKETQIRESLSKKNKEKIVHYSWDKIILEYQKYL